MKAPATLLLVLLKSKVLFSCELGGTFFAGLHLFSVIFIFFFKPGKHHVLPSARGWLFSKYYCERKCSQCLLLPWVSPRKILQPPLGFSFSCFLVRTRYIHSHSLMFICSLPSSPGYNGLILTVSRLYVLLQMLFQNSKWGLKPWMLPGDTKWWWQFPLSLSLSNMTESHSYM